MSYNVLAYGIYLMFTAYVVILGIMLFLNLILILTQRNNAAKVLAQATTKNKMTETK